MPLPYRCLATPKSQEPKMLSRLKLRLTVKNLEALAIENFPISFLSSVPCSKYDLAMNAQSFHEDATCVGDGESENHTPFDDEDSSLYGSTSVKDESSTLDLSNSDIHPLTDDAENRYFGRSESRYVRNLKALVFLVLFLVTLAVCLVIYFLTDKAQQDEFHAS
jgi:hypothetical protein